MATVTEAAYRNAKTSVKTRPNEARTSHFLPRTATTDMGSHCGDLKRTDYRKGLTVGRLVRGDNLHTYETDKRGNLDRVPHLAIELVRQLRKSEISRRSTCAPLAIHPT